MKTTICEPTDLSQSALASETSRGYRQLILGATGGFLLSCLVLTFGSGLWSQLIMGLKTATGPQIECDEPMFDFGQREGRESLSHSFVLRNKSKQPVEIKNVRSDCGCVTANVEEKTIAPGATVSVVAKLSLRGLRGRVEKHVLVESTSPANPLLSLTLQAAVTSQFDVKPEQLNLGKILDNARIIRTVEVVAPGRPFKIRKVWSDSPQVLVEHETVDDSFCLLQVSTKPPLTVGNLQTNIHVQTDMGADITIPVRCVVLGQIVVHPDVIEIGSSDEITQDRWIAVGPGSTRKFRVKNVGPPLPSVQTDVFALKDDKGYRIRIRNLGPREDLDGKMIRITTDVKGMEEITVPIRLKKTLTEASKTESR